ncbi:MAG: SOS response-associated peptidase family protein, partial [Bacteroidetes bacterium]|nr:SOS response-associated peptidase family protein [Bacteroidota bacterium]
IHPRMPFVVDEKVTDMWLDTKFDNYEALLKAIHAFDEKQIQVSPVSTKVNKVENDYAELLEPIKAHTNVQEDLFG